MSAGEVLRLKCCGNIIAFCGKGMIDSDQWKDLVRRYNPKRVERVEVNTLPETIADYCKCPKCRVMPSPCIDGVNIYQRLNIMR